MEQVLTATTRLPSELLNYKVVFKHRVQQNTTEASILQTRKAKLTIWTHFSIFFSPQLEDREVMQSASSRGPQDGILKL